MHYYGATEAEEQEYADAIDMDEHHGSLSAKRTRNETVEEVEKI